MRRWFSWLVRFRGLSKGGKDSELPDISMAELQDPGRASRYGGLDQCWTTELKLCLMCNDVRGKQRLQADKFQKSRQTQDIFILVLFVN